MLDLISYGIAAVIISIGIYKIVEGFLYDVTLRRLTKPSFNISLVDFIDLSLAYFLGMQSFLLLNLYIKNFYISGDLITILNPYKESIAIFGLMLLYIGRIITKQQSILLGKIHFSTIFIPSSVLLLIDFIKNDKITLNVFITGFNPYTISNIWDTSVYIILKFVNFIYDGKSYDQKLLMISLIGVIILSTFGEWILAKFISTNTKSLMAISDKLPSDFKVVTGISSGDDKIKYTIDNMFEGYIKSIRCITRSLRLVELIEGSIAKQYNKPNKIDRDFRIIRAPEMDALNDYKKSLDSLPISLHKVYMYVFSCSSKF